MCLLIVSQLVCEKLDERFEKKRLWGVEIKIGIRAIVKDNGRSYLFDLDIITRKYEYIYLSVL